jgi:TonB family protein
MIRLFAPPTPDPVIRRNAMTAGSLVLHVAVVVLLFVPLSQAVKQALLDRQPVYLVPPDERAGQPELQGAAPAFAPLARSGPDPNAVVVAEAEVPEQRAARGAVPLLSLTELQGAVAPRPEDHALTELQVDSAAVRDPMSAAPRYPKQLLQSGIEGLAAVLYVVDSTGMVDTTTYRIITATRPEFAVAVRQALPDMRFRPAIQDGQPVRQLVQQTFRFRINRDTAKVHDGELRPPA